MAVTREEEKVMREIQAKVAAYLKRAADAVRPVERAQSWLGWAEDLPSFLPGVALVQLADELLSSEAQEQVAGAHRRAAAEVAEWMGPDGEKYRWALRGRRDDGSPYSVAQWVDLGNDFASMFATAFNEVHEASTLGDLVQTADATEEELAAAGRKILKGVSDAAGAVVGPWDWKIKAGLWAVGLTVGTGAAAVAWQALRNTPVGLALRAGGMVARKGAEIGADVGKRVGGVAVDQVRGYVERNDAAAARKPAPVAGTPVRGRPRNARPVKKGTA